MVQASISIPSLEPQNFGWPISRYTNELIST